MSRRSLVQVTVKNKIQYRLRRNDVACVRLWRDQAGAVFVNRLSWHET